jgi:hypothetical protein
METFVWDSYRSDVRLTLTGFFVVTALIVYGSGGGLWASAPLIAAAVAFHADYRLTIDPVRRTYDKRTGVRPFSAPRQGSLDDIRHIELSLVISQNTTQYAAKVVFKGSAVIPFSIISGSLADVTEEAARLSEATGIKVVGTEEFNATRAGYENASKLIE